MNYLITFVINPDPSLKDLDSNTGSSKPVCKLREINLLTYKVVSMR